MISIPSKDLESGWKNSECKFVAPQQTVGLMIMADGDNTESSYTSEIQNLIIESGLEKNKFLNWVWASFQFLTLKQLPKEGQNFFPSYVFMGKQVLEN